MSTHSAHYAQEKFLPSSEGKKRSRVGISRKDTIVIAVLVNTMLLGLLFAFATREEGVVTKPVYERKVVESTTVLAPQMVVRKEEAQAAPRDELDEIIQAYAQKAKKKEAPVAAKTFSAKVADTAVYTEIKIKKGDSFAKIAKVHGVKIEDIMALNDFGSERLQIGQTVKVPKKNSSISQQEVSSKSAILPEGNYYVIRSGDNPWKIARRFKLKFEDLLELNRLDEESAKNLKVGDTIRIR